MIVLLLLLIYSCRASPINHEKFQVEIENEINTKLKTLNISLAFTELADYKHHGAGLNYQNFSDRFLMDGFLGVLDPGTNIPGSRYIGKHLSTLLEVLQLGQVAYEVENSLFGGASCTACKAGLMVLSFYIHGGVTKEQLIADATMMCSTFRMVSIRMCEGLVSNFGPEVYYVMKHTDQNPEQICGFMFGEACNNQPSQRHEWDILLPPINKPQPDSFQHSNEKTFKVLQLSDTHFDPFYEEGTNANCGEPLCCRSSSGPIMYEDDRAGYWGDYRKCDTPLRTLESMYRHIVERHPDIEVIYWTGDLPPHDIWNQTREGNLQVLKETSQQLRQYFPSTMILPVVGNHESAPVDSFPPPFVRGENSISWLYNVLDSEWTNWIGNGHSPTLQYGGYFSVSLAPGLRVISLNMNFCMNKNFWLLLNSTDPAEQLKWLVYELQLAEFKGEKVHIIGHLPPGHVDCVAVWSRNFNTIVNRYEHTITAQFYGHTHVDEFEIFYDKSDPGRATNIAYIAPSVSPYYGLNPTYRIYEVSLSSGRVVDHETWFLDLKQANADVTELPVWKKLYSAKEAYGLDTLNAQSWSDYVHLIDVDNNEFSKFYLNYHSGSGERPDCDPICKRRIICSLKSSQSQNSDFGCGKNKSKGWLSYLNIMNWF